MIAHATTSHRHFARDADRALLAGVCAGFAGYFGFNLRVTRLLVLIAFFCAMPITLVIYFVIVFLVPAESGRYTTRVGREGRRRRCRRSRREVRREERQAAEEERQRAAGEVSRRCESLDERLARIEKYVTSSRYDLDEEFRNL